MFEIGWTELALIAVVAIVVIGPKDLPRAMRAVGQWSGRLKRMAREFQGQFNEALREADLGDVKKNVESLTKFDPMAIVRKEVNAIDASLRKDPAAPAPPAPAATPDPAAPPAPVEAAAAPAAMAPLAPVEAAPAPKVET